MPVHAAIETRRITAVLFAAIFFLSGLAGLAYQVIWTKSFAAAIGHEYPAMLAVISAFMCGMAAGNLFLTPFRRISPRCYGWLEIIIGLWALAITLLTPAIQSVVFQLLGAAPSPERHWLVVFIAVFFALFPATAAMGATLPAAERFLAAKSHRPVAALLYAVNTGGAMLGALLAAFWIMPVLGLRFGTILLAGTNIFCGIAALLVARHSPAAVPQPGPNQKPPRRLALQLFLIGLAGIGFEVAMVRGLSQILENTVYTFAAVLATYLGGTALGAFLYHRLAARPLFNDPTPLLAGLSVSSLLAAIVLRWMPSMYLSLRFAAGDSLFAVAAAESIVTLGLLLLPCLFMGATWSCFTQGSLRYRPNLGWAVFLNTLGAAVGPALWGLVLIPFAGLQAALAAVPAAYAAISLTLPGRARLAAGLLVLAAGTYPLVTSNRDLIDTSGGRLVSLREGVMGSVSVVDLSADSRVLKFNNRFQMGGTAARIAEQRQADIPLLLHPNPRRALFIGLGTGISFNTAAYYPELVAEGVELAPEIARAMPLFNETAPDATNLFSHIADGRRFVRVATNRYDVIIGDLFHPAQDGAGFLYTREHFRAIRERLAGGGLFCQWLPLYQMDLGTLAIITATFQSVFPNSQQWLLRLNIDTPVIGLVGWANGGLQPGIVEKQMAAHPALARHLRSVGLTDTTRLFGCFIRSIQSSPRTKLNTDAHPMVIFRAPAITFQRHDNPAGRLLALLEPGDASLPVELSPEVQKYIAARNVYLRGAVEESHREIDAALAAFIESAKISPDFTAGYAQALALASTLAKSDPHSARAILEALIQAQPERPVARELLDRLQIQN